MFLIDRGPGPVSRRSKHLAQPAGFSPRRLFASGAAGAWFDPSDRSTLFEDVAGTIPAIQPGQPVGLMLDKSGNGHPATQPVAASRPTLARRPKGGRRNLIPDTSTILLAGSGAASIKAEVYLPTADRWNIHSFVGSNQRAVNASVAMPAGETYTGSIYLDPSRITDGTTFQIYFGLLGSQRASVTLAASAGVLTAVGSTGFSGYFDLLDWRLLALPDGKYRLVMTMKNVFASAMNVVHGVWSTASTVVVTTTSAQIEARAAASPYQRAASLYDLTELGVADCWGLHFDGVDDFMVTAEIDLTGSDKVGLFAGLQKMSDAAIAVPVEFSPAAGVSNPGSFCFLTPLSLGNPAAYTFRSVGTVQANSSSGSSFPAPHSAVLTGLGDIAEPRATLRVNGEERSRNSDSQGAGRFGKYALTLGRRTTGINYYFPGLMTGVVLAGKLPSAAETARTEAFLNRNMGAF